ncbi:Acyl-CoA synthetase (AMP-forming)/AMP-acid ligase II [Streptoalloteichus tenebrarius]|uniref:Acyl-CoA synthetase (AMP-forming)/AMP-acid ligase II n=1 Tax=Streptoalloteichus tenebrarius (strain ATCC 17920 / DSM 40477 / JCM 4838 / CBS 697.72 / NBRC 16177 / NCIMB 11028 / NRRL B-12390 / A12253. 1 / ISP 5477) TaxID=1933 RepID=A0ABT1HQW9_STRSD|nr:AMP-binding protein [Streptoalloteichus tenebrarius]MCP2257898.1 Acyl-CoA synthetase (AMP-forming)/AMP-acid ligase II [Streptoalloteichus tenebrarius]BFE99740.1 AMP-binding protein [Streptoalloteichus tenebrarius]
MRVPLTVADFLDRAETVFADSTAIVDEPTQPAAPVPTTTYGELARRVRAWQAGLDALGVAEGERVAVASHNAARLLELLYAVPASGRVAVPVNFRLRPDEVDYIVEHSGASVLLVDPELEESLRGVHAPKRFVLGEQTETEVMRFDVEPRPWSRPDEDATATINYTSGTTARPKGVRLTHRNIWVDTVTFGLHTRTWERDVYLHTLPTFHCNGWNMPYVLAGLGAKQVVLRKVDGAEILRRVDEHGVTLMFGAPAVWNLVLDAARHWEGEIPGRDRVRIVCAGAPPPTRMIARVEEELGWEFQQIYGLTETSPLLTFNRTRPADVDLPAEERARKLSRAGAPALGVRLRISETGEVLARANVVLDGYWRNDEATEEALAGGWFHTGDGGEIDAEGHLTISDRKKDVIISGGENVSSIEVEDCIFAHPAVAEVAVIGVPHEKWGETVKALVVLAEGAQATEQEIIAHCKERLAGYKAPTSVEFRDAIPRTATGKIQKFKLREPYWAGRSRQVN